MQVVTINPTNISFTPGSAISVSDGAGSKSTISLRISLQTTLPANIEGSKFVFELSDGGISVESVATSSQLAAFTAYSSITSNAIDITASKLLFIQQPSDVDQNMNMTPSVTVAFTDDNGNIDLSYASEQISIVSTGVTLSGLIIGKTEKEMCTCFAMR